MIREDFDKIKIIDVEINKYKDQPPTLYLITGNKEDDLFLNQVLHSNTFEFGINDEKILYLNFPDPHYGIKLKRLSEIKGHMQIVLREVNFLNTLCWGHNETPLVNFSNRLAFPSIDGLV